jgi:hypothetical protein
MDDPPQTYYGVALSCLLLAFIVRLCMFDSHEPLPDGGQAFVRVLQFVSLSLTCTLPRLYFDVTSLNSYPISHNPSAAHYEAIIYTWIEAFLVGWPRIVAYLFLLFIGPDTQTINGLEYGTVSIIAWEMDLPLATAFFFCNTVEFFVHQPIRRYFSGAIPTDVPKQLRVSLVEGAILYCILCAVRLLIPYYSYLMMIGATGVAIIWALVVQWINLFHFDQLTTEAMHKNEDGELVYKALETKTSFRLIRIRPSMRYDAIVRCDLYEEPSPHEAPNTFLAVSYRWDTSLGKCGRIIMNGEELMVYPKLERILREMRASYWAKIVWIDQICINQEDPIEKSTQVAMMDEIYGRSNQVRICLLVPGVTVRGFWAHLVSLWDPTRYPAWEEIEAADSLIWKLNTSRFIQDYTPGNSNSNSNDLGELLSFAPIEQWKALAKLLDDPWFQRIWVVQEVGLAQEIYIHYGHTSISWDTFVRAMAALARSNLRRFPELLSTIELGHQKENAAIDNVLIMENLRTPSKRLPLLESIILCQRFQATERVDKIYALLGISSSEDPMIGLEVDYSISPAEAFTNTARSLLRGDPGPEQFRILRSAGFGQSDVPDLPSWVPDWNLRMTSSSLGHRNDAMDFAASPVKEYAAPGVLHTSNGKEHGMLIYKGFKIDRIKVLVDVSTLPAPDSLLLTLTPFLDALAASSAAKTPYFTNQPPEEAFWRTIIADTHPLTRPAPDDYWRHWQHIFTRSDTLRSKDRTVDEESEFADLCRTLEYASSPDLIFTHLLATDLSKDRRDHGAGSFDAILNRSYDYSHEHDPRATLGRQFCVTEKGYMGLVPKTAGVGDAIVVLHSAGTPHVLRGPVTLYCEDCEVDVECWRLIGEGYMHGLMDHTVSGIGEYFEEEFKLL